MAPLATLVASLVDTRLEIPPPYQRPSITRYLLRGCAAARVRRSPTRRRAGPHFARRAARARLEESRQAPPPPRSSRGAWWIPLPPPPTLFALFSSPHRCPRMSGAEPPSQRGPARGPTPSTPVDGRADRRLAGGPPQPTSRVQPIYAPRRSERETPDWRTGGRRARRQRVADVVARPTRALSGDTAHLQAPLRGREGPPSNVCG